MTKITPTIAAPFIGAVLLSTTALAQESFTINGGDQAVSVTPVTEFDEPWAMTFLPDGTMLVTEKGGTLLHVTQGGEKTEVSGVPAVAYGGQGGLGDVVLHPDFAENDMVYLSYAEEGEGGYGAALARGTLDLSGNSPATGIHARPQAGRFMQAITLAKTGQPGLANLVSNRCMSNVRLAPKHVP